MCCLAGYYNLELHDKSRQELLLRHLMRKAQVRGDHAFGLAYREGGKTELHRELGPVSKRLAEDEAWLRRISASGIVLAQTKNTAWGETSVRNAHPFLIGGWIGASNGKLENSGELLLEAEHVPLGESRTEEALAWLATKGFSAQSFGRLRGCYAMTILKEDASEFLIAVDERMPFALAEVEGGIVWHSIAAALKASLRAVGIGAEVREVKSLLLRFPGSEEVSLPSSAALAEDGASG